MAQTTSELWKTLLTAKNTRKEYKFSINGVEYGEDSEVSHSVESSLYEEFSIGNATCAKLNIELFADDIPMSAEIKRFVRLVNGEQKSEWLPAGEFFTNRRSNDDGLWTIEAFDAMRKADQPWVPDQSLSFPMPMPDAVSELCKIMGIELDERTELNQEYTVDHPASNQESDTGENYTVRQILQWIAAAHGANWIITPSGALRLVPVEKIDIFGEDEQFHKIGQDLTGFSNNGLQKAISRVTLFLDEENVITSGDDTGMELSADCYYATQDMADAILGRLAGYEYQMYSAEAVNIDPAVELGDNVEVDGIQSVISIISDDGNGYPDISAPGEAEMEDEYPSNGGPKTREFDRKISQTKSEIKKTAEEISLSITSLSQNMDASNSRFENGVSEIIDQLSQLQLLVDSLNLSFTQIRDNGVDQVTTKTGYTFNADGLDIHRSGDEIHNTIDNTGMYVRRGQGEAAETMLQANAAGVVATDLTARNYLIVGTHARFEDYGEDRTACFHL